MPDVQVPVILGLVLKVLHVNSYCVACDGRATSVILAMTVGILYDIMK